MNYKPWEVTKLLWSIKTMLNTLTKRYFQGGMSGLFYFELRVNCPQTMSIHQTMLRCPFESKKIWNSIAIALPTSWNCWPLSVTTQLTTYTQCCILMLQAILWQADLLTKTRGEQWSFFGSDGMVMFFWGYSIITINWFSASRPLLSMFFRWFCGHSTIGFNIFWCFCIRKKTQNIWIQKLLPKSGDWSRSSL